MPVASYLGNWIYTSINAMKKFSFLMTSSTMSECEAPDNGNDLGPATAQFVCFTKSLRTIIQ